MASAILNSVLTPLVHWPLRLLRAPVRLLLVVTGARKKRSYRLPVAGLEQSKAQGILFALRRAATTPEEEAVARDWLVGWQLAQVASNRLLHELDDVQANLQFWDSRVRRGGHFWFLLLQQGPRGFYRRLRQLFAAPLPGAGAAVPLLSEAEMVEKRVLIFRLLRTALCEALARVQVAGALLYLQERPTGHGRSPVGSDTEIVLVGEEREESLFERASRAVEAALGEIVQAFDQLHAAVHAALDIPEAQPLAAAEEAHGREAALLAQTVQKVLGLHHLRRLFSRDQLGAQQAVQQGAGQGGEIAVAAGEEGAAPAAATATAAGAGEEPAGGTAAALLRARRALGLAAPAAGGAAAAALLPPLPPAASAHAALGAARSAARRLRRSPLLSLPRWLRMPSELERHWIKYSLVGVGVGYATLFLYKHSRLSGSRDLEDWSRKGIEAAQGAVKEHVARPLRQVKDELFNTFRRRPTIVSMDEFIADRDSLQRMLDDFKADLVRRKGAGALPAAPAAPTSGPSAAALPAEAGAPAVPADLAPAGAGELVPLDAPATLEGMQLVMRCYEDELKRPIRNLVNGELARSLLIQVQKMKVDTESAMLEMDQILRANELSISLVAAVPAFLIAGATLYSIGRWLTPTPPDPRWEAVPCRLGMVEVGRALERLCRGEEGGAPSAEDQGWFFYCLAVEYEEAAQLFRRHTNLLLGGSARSEWPALQADLVDLAVPAPAKQRMRTAKRMMRAYSVFHQF